MKKDNSSNQTIMKIKIMKILLMNKKMKKMKLKY